MVQQRAFSCPFVAAAAKQRFTLKRTMAGVVAKSSKINALVFYSIARTRARSYSRFADVNLIRAPWREKEVLFLLKLPFLFEAIRQGERTERERRGSLSSQNEKSIGTERERGREEENGKQQSTIWRKTKNQ